MTPAFLERIGQAMYGSEWMAPLAHDLGNGTRTVARWFSGYSEIPEGLADELRHLLERRADEIATVRADLDIAIAREPATPDVPGQIERDFGDHR